MTLSPAVHASDPLVGCTLAGKYLVQARLGEGAMGVVYRAMHLGLEHPVALKVLKHALLAQTANVERLRREARTIAQLKSQHTVQVLDSGQLESGCPYIVMEYLEGEDLGSVLARTGPLPLRDAAGCALSVIDALAEAHAHGIVHRDLKPENLFITRPRPGVAVIKLLDFGIATSATQALSRLTQPEIAVGSPQYMAPEQVLAVESITPNADVWALGVTLYELTTAQLPFDGSSLAAVCAAIVQADPRPPSVLRGDLPAAFDDLVLDCLRKDPRRRPSLAELGDRLRRCCSRSSGSVEDRADRSSAPLPIAAPELVARHSDTGLAHTIVHNTRARGARWWMRGVLAFGSLALGALGWVGAHGLLSEGSAPNARAVAAQREPALGPPDSEPARAARDRATPAAIVSFEPEADDDESAPADSPARRHAVSKPKAKVLAARPKPAPKPAASAVAHPAPGAASTSANPESNLPDFGGRY